MRLDFTLLALAAPLAVVGNPHSIHRRHHHDLAKRADGSVQLHKRFGQTRWTFYDVGGAAGACGAFNSPEQHIVALNSQQYGGGYPGPNCGRKIVMTLNGKTTTATITDECPGCPFGGLDLTRGLFQFFAPLSVGVLTGDWHFADEGGDPAPEPPKPKPKPKPTTSHAPPPPPPSPTHHTTTTHAAATTTHSTHSVAPSSTHSASASSSVVSHASLIPTSIVLGSGPIPNIPTGGVVPGNVEVQNIQACNELLVNLGGLASAGADTA